MAPKYTTTAPTDEPAQSYELPAQDEPLYVPSVFETTTAANGTPALPRPEAPASDALETVMLVVDRCLGHGPKDDKKRRALAAWLAQRHPDKPAAWWLEQWGLG